MHAEQRAGRAWVVIVMPANIPTAGVVLMRFRHCDLSCTITNVQPPPANGGLISISRGARSRRSRAEFPSW